MAAITITMIRWMIQNRRKWFFTFCQNVRGAAGAAASLPSDAAASINQLACQNGRASEFSFGSIQPLTLLRQFAPILANCEAGQLVEKSRGFCSSSSGRGRRAGRGVGHCRLCLLCSQELLVRGALLLSTRHGPVACMRFLGGCNTFW